MADDENSKGPDERDMSLGTDIDGVMTDSRGLGDMMDSRGPGDVMNISGGSDSWQDHSDDSQLTDRGAEGKENVTDNVMTTSMQSESSEISVPSTAEDGLSVNSSETSREPAVKKQKKDSRRVTDSFLIERNNTPGDGGAGKLNETFSGSRPSSVASSGKSGTPGKDAKAEEARKLYMIWSGRTDPAKKEKEREREDRIRAAQTKLAEDRQRKIDEMREAQRLAQENREKQLEARRKKIEELKKREEERRKQVEERRRTQEEQDRAKKEAILSKAKERLTRYEQWKSHGRKGGRRHVLGFGSRTPREVCLPLDARRSSSQSTLRRSPNSSDYDSYFNRRAVSASSVVRRHCCIDINKLTQGMGFPGDSPPSKKLSQSTSVLYHKRSPEFSSSGAINTAGTGSLKAGAESMMALHSIPENRLGRSVVASAPPTRHKSTVNLREVKMRDPSKTRKPRPSSVATSMPSFVRVETDSPKSTRSKSSDRGVRDHSKSRVSIRTDDDKTDGKERKAATLPRPYDRKKIEERRQEVKKKQEERKEREAVKEKERMSKSEITETNKDKPPARLSRSFIERMAAPRHTPDKKESPAKESSPAPVKAKVTVKDKPPKAPVKSSPSKVKDTATGSKVTGTEVEVTDSKVKITVSEDSQPDTTSSSSSPAPRATPPQRVTPTIQVEEAEPEPLEGVIEVGKADSAVAEERAPSPAVSDERSSSRSPAPATPASPPRQKPEPKQATPEPGRGGDKADKPKTDKEREMEEYKAKLAEKRRLAREKAEREAEIERLRQEELQRQEEERAQAEEERQRREEEEALRLAAEARVAEEERLRLAIEAEDQRKREEAARLEQERLAKEEAEKKAREEAERREKEMAERAKREEEERNDRRKRLEMIMKRVKTDGSTPDKARNESPTRTVTASSSRTSLVSSEDERADDSEGAADTLKPDDKSGDTPKFKSPLLQKLNENKTQNGDSGTPKFKSPLLQSIMGKTKIGARLSATRLDEMERSTENLTMSKSMECLSGSSDSLISKQKDSDPDKDTDTSEPSRVTNGVSASDKCDNSEQLLVDDSSVTRADSHDAPRTVISEGSEDRPLICDSMTASVPAHESITDSQLLIGSTADSAVSLSFNGGTSSHNGDIHLDREPVNTKDLVDSSISVRTIDSPESPQTAPTSAISVGLDVRQAGDPNSSNFEEIIDLNTVPSRPVKGSASYEDSLLNHSGDGFTINNLGGLDNGHMTEGGDATVPVAKPIIAFEENATRQDVPDLLS